MDTETLLWSVALLLASIVLATVEHGWSTLSRTRLAGAGGGPASRTRLEQMLEHGDRAESALIVLRVGVQVALVLWLYHLAAAITWDGEPVSALTAALLSGGFGFLWITLACRTLPQEVSLATLERMVRATMPIVVVLGYVLAPPVEWFRRLFRLLTGRAEGAEAELYQDEILSTVEEGEREGHIGGEQADMIEQILELAGTEVHEHMTPRTEVKVVPVDGTVGDALEVARQWGHSRFPLVSGSVDDVVGLLHVKDLLAHDLGEPVRPLARKPWFVPETKSCTDLLAEFRKHRMHMAIVLDEYGGTAGIITIEDVLEEIVGEIEDEYDPHTVEPLRIIDEAHAEAAGAMHVDEVNEALSISIPESDDWSTLGGFIFCTLGRLPRVGERLKHDNIVLTVKGVTDRRIDKVGIEILQTAA